MGQNDSIKRNARRKRRKRRVLRFLKCLLLSAVLVLALYLGVVWFVFYRQQEAVVNFSKLRAQQESLNNGADVATGFEEALQELLQKNEETADFVKNYTNRDSYIGKEIDLSEEVKVGIVPLLLQWDKRWGYELYGENLIALAGCGPTCLSMAYLYFTEDLEGNPREIARYCEQNGFHTEEGTSWDLWTLGVKELGLSGEVLPLDENRMKNALDKEQVIICSMRPGDFTEIGHYILIRGYDENGFYINDPNSVRNSEKQWSYETIKGQIKNLWGIGL